LLGIVIALSIFNTAIALFQLVPTPINLIGYGGLPSFGSTSEVYVDHSYQFAVGGWLFVIGALIWRGRVRNSWEKRGFERAVFELFVQKRGSTTRMSMLKALSEPKDRLQLAKELDCDWNVADRQIRILLEHGLVREEKAYGNVRFYQLTATGRNLLELINKGEVLH
jgi:predicted transcriptional regulator